jgi:hypothetical protein
MAQGLGEEPAGGRLVALRRDQDVDDLPELVQRPIQVDRLPGDLGLGFVDEPSVARHMPAGPGGVEEQRGEPLHPPMHVA